MNISPKNVAAIHDLSGLGRCSLTAVVPILSVMGLHCCPLPTAVLSNQTGYDDYTFLDLTANLPGYISHWEKLGICFDTIYSGFLGSESQIDIVIDFIKRFSNPGTLVAVDPVMGDNGKMYSAFSVSLCNHMKNLIRHADIVFPNITEAMLLTDCNIPISEIRKSDISFIAREISKAGPQQVIITGAVNGDYVTNYVFDFKNNQITEISEGYNHKSYSGTGDIFASIVCGGLTLGRDLNQSVTTAAHFIEKAVRYTDSFNSDTKEGVIFEPFLKELCINA